MTERLADALRDELADQPGVTIQQTDAFVRTQYTSELVPPGAHWDLIVHKAPRFKVFSVSFAGQLTTSARRALEIVGEVQSGRPHA